MTDNGAIASVIGFATLIMWVYLARIYGEIIKIRKAMENKTSAQHTP